MKEKYPIVKIDRTTVQEFLPILMNKGIFTDYHSLPTRDEILENERNKSGVSLLAPETERRLLSGAGTYRTNKSVVRDYGNYAIAFNLTTYVDYGKDDFDDSSLAEPLSRIRLYKLAHRIVLVILAKVYENRKFTQLEITKQELLDCLGYKADERHVYRDISDVMFSLTRLNYQIFKYRKRTKIDENFKAIGYFIYNLVEDQKGYAIDVNEKFVGCISSLFNEKRENTRENFAGGYLSYPTSIIPVTKGYSTAAYLLTNHLIAEEGNRQLNDMNYKVVAFKVELFMSVMNIKAGRASKRKSEFIKALKEVEIIESITPGVADLTNLGPLELEKTVIHIKVKREIRDLDRHIKSILLGANEG